MESIIDKVYQREYSNWIEHENSISVKQNDNTFLLNITTAIVWKMIDGERTGREIIERMYELYSDHNSKEYLTDLYLEAVTGMLQKKIIKEVILLGGRIC